MSEHGSDCDSCSEAEKNPSDDSVMTKYKTAGEIATSVLKDLISKSVEGVGVLDLCISGDQMILTKTSKAYARDKKIKKGIAFPTCVALNNSICHYSPLQSDNSLKLNHGDLVKIDLGVHIDGFVACLATTIVVGATKADPVRDRRADVIAAGHVAAGLALKIFRPLNTNHMVTDTITDTALEFKCKPVEGLMSYNTKKDVLEGDNTIMLNPTDLMKKDYRLAVFQPWDVYAVDIFMSTNKEPKPKDHDTRTTVYRRTTNSYNLKLKISREIFKHVLTNHGEFAFTLRSLGDENKVKLGIKECIDHNLVMTYPVLYDKEGEFVSHFKFTVIVGPNGPLKVAFPPFALENIKSEFKLQKRELINLLNEALTIKKKPEIEKKEQIVQATV